MKIRINITEKQRNTLEPLFTEVEASNQNGTGSVIAAQIFRDGIRIRLLKGDAAKALCEALGGNYDDTISSSHE